MTRFVAVGIAACLLCGCAASTREMPAPARSITTVKGITVWPDTPSVEIQAWTCLDAGWLEQVACAPGSREHESLVVIKARPSDVHAALLLAGWDPGAPGRWSYDDGDLSFTPPTGDRVDVHVRYERQGRTVEEPMRAWMADAEGGASFPETAWVFAGSLIAPNPEWMGPGEHYVADQTGSIIGLVTFGDETVGFEQVLADQQDVQPLEWQVRTEHVPPPGTPVTLILRPFSIEPGSP
jgi:hypothetical protein